MATVVSHAIAAVALKTPFAAETVPKRVWLLGGFFAMLPDIDVVGFRFGIAYTDLFGHRGFTHSLLFAAVLALLGAFALFPTNIRATRRWLVWLYLFVATASHSLLDALTNGGHGVAFFAPFDNSRYFFPFTPLEVSPIGLSRFFSARGAEVLLNEAVWIWIPAAFLLLTAAILRRLRRGKFAAPAVASRG